MTNLIINSLGVCLMLVHIVDIHSTYLAIKSTHGKESNPLFKWFNKLSLKQLLLCMIFIKILVLYGIYFCTFTALAEPFIQKFIYVIIVIFILLNIHAIKIVRNNYKIARNEK